MFTIEKNAAGVRQVTFDQPPRIAPPPSAFAMRPSGPVHQSGFMGQAAGLPPDLEGSCKSLEKLGRDHGILGTDPIQGFASVEQIIRQGGGWNTIMTSDQARTCYMRGYDEASSTWRDPRYRQGAAVGAIAGLIVGVGGTLLVTKVIL